MRRITSRPSPIAVPPGRPAPNAEIAPALAVRSGRILSLLLVLEALRDIPAVTNRQKV